jgi:hypothetical protein
VARRSERVAALIVNRFRIDGANAAANRAFALAVRFNLTGTIR